MCVCMRACMCLSTCVCVCVRARARVCVCLNAYARGACGREGRNSHNTIRAVRIHTLLGNLVA